MSDTLDIVCPECEVAQILEVKDVSIDGVLVSFEFDCPCGFKTRYKNLQPDQFEALVRSQSQTQWLADWLGIPAERLEKYEYPPDVMKEVDLERRKLRGAEIKARLKASRMNYPIKSENGWWQVYVLPGDVTVEFDRATKAYRIQTPDTIENCKDVHEFSTAIQKHG